VTVLFLGLGNSERFDQPELRTKVTDLKPAHPQPARKLPEEPPAKPTLNFRGLGTLELEMKLLKTYIYKIISVA
jgi:hypothetical protein